MCYCYISCQKSSRFVYKNYMIFSHMFFKIKIKKIYQITTEFTYDQMKKNIIFKYKALIV